MSKNASYTKVPAYICENNRILDKITKENAFRSPSVQANERGKKMAKSAIKSGSVPAKVKEFAEILVREVADRDATPSHAKIAFEALLYEIGFAIPVSARIALETAFSRDLSAACI